MSLSENVTNSLAAVAAAQTALDAANTQLAHDEAELAKTTSISAALDQLANDAQALEQSVKDALTSYIGQIKALF